MDTAAVPPAHPATAGPLWCRKCDQPVAVLGDRLWGRAVHSGTGEEKGPDGHLAAPLDVDPDTRKRADAIAAEFCGVFQVSARLGVLRADWVRVPPGATVPHFEDVAEDGLRAQLRAALKDAAQ